MNAVLFSEDGWMVIWLPDLTIGNRVAILDVAKERIMVVWHKDWEAALALAREGKRIPKAMGAPSRTGRALNP